MRFVATGILLLALAAVLFLDLAALPDLLVAVLYAVVGISVFGVIGLWGGYFLRRRRMVVPRSQIAEMERLYFRAIREMLTDQPNYAQAINDLQRILAINPYYKNARHYLQRAQILQQEADVLAAGPAGQITNFDSLQERLLDLDPAVRKAVVIELIQYGEVAVDPLIALLMDEDADVRVHAATALGWVGGRDAVQPLLVALNDADTQVRRYAARAMCWVVDHNAVDGLIAALHDEDNYVRCYAARALGWSRDERAIAPLMALLDDPNADVREYVTTALLDLDQRIPA
jgi:uncharacterized protein YneF (UPF0154 family)